MPVSVRQKHRRDPHRPPRQSSTGWRAGRRQPPRGRVRTGGKVRPTPRTQAAQAARRVPASRSARPCRGGGRRPSTEPRCRSLPVASRHLDPSRNQPAHGQGARTRNGVERRPCLIQPHLIQACPLYESVEAPSVTFRVTRSPSRYTSTSTLSPGS